MDQREYAGALIGTFNGVDVSPLYCMNLFLPIGVGSYYSDRQDPQTALNQDRAGQSTLAGVHIYYKYTSKGGTRKQALIGHAPEIDGGSAASALTMLSGAMLLLRGRRRRG